MIRQETSSQEEEYNGVAEPMEEDSISSDISKIIESHQYQLDHDSLFA